MVIYYVVHDTLLAAVGCECGWCLMAWDTVCDTVRQNEYSGG